MILCDRDILREMKAKRFSIIPFDEGMLQPASYDLRVGKDAATVPKEEGGSFTMDLEKEGIIVIPPYAPAIIYTMETLSLPLNLAGRFGLKSGLSRRGVYASVGPQVDPGFEGPLSVTLYNFTPTSVALNYGDSFLSLELHRLSHPASKGYDGEYQRRRTFTAKEIEPVLGYKGHGLSAVVQGFQETRDALNRVADLPKKFEAFLESYENQNRESAEFNKALITEMKKLVEYIAGDRPRTVVLRAIPREEAIGEIVQLFKQSKKPLFYSDVAERLNLDLELVVELCNELEKDGQIGVLTPYETKRPKAKR